MRAEPDAGSRHPRAPWRRSPLSLPVGVYAALCGGAAFPLVGHHSGYASQRLGFPNSGGLELPLDVPIAEVTRSVVRVAAGSLTERVLRLQQPRRSRPFSGENAAVIDQPGSAANR
jgi:hypothetical protein